MNRRQAKKKLYREYGIITPRQTAPRQAAPRQAAPRQAAPRQEKRLALSLIDYEALEKLADDLRDCFKRLGETIRDTIEKLGEILSDIAEKYEPYKKPKFKPVKSLIKPYRQPFIKVRYRARANL